MPYNGRILAAARKELEEVRTRNMEEQRRRTETIYLRIPEIRDIDLQLRGQMARLVALSFRQTEDQQEKLNALKEANLDLQMKKAELLTSHGYHVEYLDEICTCPKCRDTGSLKDGAVCTCLDKIYNRLLNRQLSTLLRTGDESFEHFRLDYYSPVYSEEFKVVPRDQMAIIFDACRRFADKFPDVSSNLLLHGGPGLGKTYLSACIARQAAAKGCSVCYESVSSAIDAFERQKFSRDPEESSAADEQVRMMLDSDLMILDDLGTEMLTPMASSGLYTLLNTRLIHHKPIIISTNLKPTELEKRYSPAIASRINGEFMPLPFVGSDIRRLEKPVK